MTLFKDRDEFNETTRHEKAHAMMISSVNPAESRLPAEVGKLRAAGLSLLWIGMIVVCA
jgi:hypothetical protein